MGDEYASGSWKVGAGNEEKFQRLWVEFLEWTKADCPGFKYAGLIQETGNPRHFISFAAWEDTESRAAWKHKPGFRDRRDACVSLCDDFQGADYESAAQVG